MSSSRFLATSVFLAATASLIPSVAHATPVYSACTCSPTTTPSNNKTQHPEIVLAFWENESEWEDGSQQPTRAQWVGAALSMVNTAFLSQLGEYAGSGGMSRPRLAPYAPIWQGPAPISRHTTGNFTNQDIVDIEQNMMISGQLPPPLPADDTVYILILPAGSNDKNAGNSGGGYNFGSNNHDYSTDPFTAIYIVDSTTQSTGFLGHETAEAISAYNGIGINNCPGNSQIADVCQCGGCGPNPPECNEVQNGVYLGAYWSDQRKKCILPESYGALEVDTGGGWTTPANGMALRQAYGGAGGVVGTGIDDNIYFYDGSGWRSGWVRFGNHWAWTAKPLGMQGAELAAGGNNVATIPLDTSSGVQYYDLTADVWTDLGVPPASKVPPGIPAGDALVTSVTITSSGFIVVTDAFGDPWYWDWNTGAWADFGSPGDQFVASGNDILGLSQDRQTILTYPGSGFGGAPGSWSRAASAAPFEVAYAQIVGGTNDDGGANWATLSSWLNATFYQGGNLMAVSLQDLAANEVNVNGYGSGGGFLGLTIGQQHAVEYYRSNATWASVGAGGGAFGRVVSGHGMYATACTGARGLNGAAPCISY